MKSSNRATSSSSTFLIAAVFALATFGIYHSNGPLPLGSYDSAPNSLLAFDLFSRGRLDFDPLRGGALVENGAAYAFVEAPDGHYVSIFPFGTAIVTLPVYGVFAATRLARGEPIDIASPSFEPVRQRDEKAAATIVAALAAALFFLCARAIAGVGAAAIVTVAFALGTPMWTIGSQALWQHGSVCLMLLAMIGALVRSVRAGTTRGATRWLALAGLCAGLLVTVRPTAALFAFAGLVFAGWGAPRRALPFAIAALAGLAPLVVWNLEVFHTLAGGYAAPLGLFRFDPGAAAIAFAGELVSPNRGLFVFTPVVLFAIPGARRAARAGTPDARLVLLLGAACVVLALQYAFTPNWWGGWTYGPRYLTDTMPVLLLLVLYALPARWPGRVLFGLALTVSVAVQVAGANGGSAVIGWNATPVAVEQRPDRIWDAGDLQIARAAQGFVAQFAH